MASNNMLCFANVCGLWDDHLGMASKSINIIKIECIFYPRRAATLGSSHFLLLISKTAGSIYHDN